MANVKLVIEIDEEQKKMVDAIMELPPQVENDLISAIRHGAPLPKGHGRLVDIGKIDEDRMDSNNPIIYSTINGEYIEAISLDYLNSLPTIIEADKAESEEN